MRKEFEKAISVLKEGGIIAFKTDTVMGIGANGFDRQSVKKLFDLKKRPYDKPVSVLVHSVSKLFEYVLVSKKALEIIKAHFPGAITCILPAKEEIYTTPVRYGKTLGIRIPDFVELLEFLSVLKFPLVATSANISGKLPLESEEDILKTFSRNVYYLKFRYNIKMSGVASTVVDCTNGNAKILREGSIKI